MIIAVDFDGTVVTHCYPSIGRDIGAVPVLKKLIDRGDKLILFTMRSGIYLEEAINWFKENKIELFGVNINPEQKKWTDSPKVYAQLYIDDAGLNIPLIYPSSEECRPYVDWVKVEKLLFDIN